MTGRSSKSYKHRVDTGYIIVLWQNLDSATYVTLTGSPRRPWYLVAFSYSSCNHLLVVAAVCNYLIVVATPATALQGPPWLSQRLLAGKRRDNAIIYGITS
jgi:hypothetical protein